MITEELRRLVRATPFRPFRLRLTDGRSIEVPHPEYILVLHHEPMAIVERHDGCTELINLPIVVGIESLPATT